MDQHRKPSSIFDRSFSFRSTQEKPQPMKKMDNIDSNSTSGMVKRLCNSFESARRKNLSLDFDTISTFKRSISSRLSNLSRTTSMTSNSIRLPNTEDRVVVFFTSLRGIRRTYEDCRVVRMIFKGFRVSVDERDISMDSAYRKELQGVLGEKTVTLPQVFVRGKFVGGAEEIKQLHESGELAKLLKGLPARDPRLVCESCGDARFVPCLNCSGSRKIFNEEEDQLRRCADCNENGLMRCPECNH